MLISLSPTALVWNRKWHHLPDKHNHPKNHQLIPLHRPPSSPLTLLFSPTLLSLLFSPFLSQSFSSLRWRTTRLQVFWSSAGFSLFLLRFPSLLPSSFCSSLRPFVSYFFSSWMPTSFCFFLFFFFFFFFSSYSNSN